MDKVGLKQKIRLHLKLLAESNRCGSEIDATATDIYNLFRVYAQQVDRERTFEFLRRFFGINPDDKVVNSAYDKYFKNQQQCQQD